MNEAEVKERIAKILEEYSRLDYLFSEESNGEKPDVNAYTGQILDIMKEAGYRLMPELKVLTDEELDDIPSPCWGEPGPCTREWSNCQSCRQHTIAQSQLDADKKAIERGEMPETKRPR